MPVVAARPGRLQTPLQAPPEQNRARLIDIGVRNVQSCADFDGREFRPRARLGLADKNDNLAGVTARSPEKIILMAANGSGQPVTRTEKVDRAGLAVVVTENGRFLLFLRGKRMIDASDGGDLLLPGHFVSVILWERGANEAALGGLGLQRRMRFVEIGRAHV